MEETFEEVANSQVSSERQEEAHLSRKLVLNEEQGALWF